MGGLRPPKLCEFYLLTGRGHFGPPPNRDRVKGLKFAPNNLRGEIYEAKIKGRRNLKIKKRCRKKQYLYLYFLSGCVVWLLDTWYNQDDFPAAFPRGIFEGFWWAFVSMTTVGYGDRAPKSFFARIFAIFWILLGVTIFSMYTGG